MIVKLAMMQRDETLLLEPWLTYHGYMFGFENLYVHDNGSQEPAVLETLARYERIGVTVAYGPRDGSDFDAKGTLLADVIRKWDAGPQYDFAFPIDCDEFIALWENGTVSCRRNDIVEYLCHIRHRQAHFKVETNLFNIPGHPGWYWPQDGTKTFFASRTLRHLDHGFHFGSVRNGAGVLNTAITYFHFHFKPYAEFVRSARAKLAPYVDVDDVAALRSYAGPNGHLLEGLLGGQEAYDSRLAGCLRIHLPEMGLLLRALGKQPEMLNEGEASLAIPNLAVAKSKAPVPDAGEYEVFDGRRYLRH